MFTVRKKGRGLYLARTFSSNAPPAGAPVLSSVEFGGKKWGERERGEVVQNKQPYNVEGRKSSLGSADRESIGEPVDWRGTFKSL